MYLLVTGVQSVIFAAGAAGLIFDLAERWDLWNEWVYVGILLALSLFRDLVMYRKSPDLLKERLKLASGGRDGKLLIIFVGALVLFLLHWSVAGLDQRFHWSDPYPAGRGGCRIGDRGYRCGFGIWPMLVNPFFSTAVRIQSDRGQQVITSGPYIIVRHPGYAGFVMALVASAMALNWLLSIIPAVIMVVVVARRTAIEHRMLQSELAGYPDYSAKVRFRLIPGVW
jgi:protein-S-isoprenylcysteine O-methyltransferase Ste14